VVAMIALVGAAFLSTLALGRGAGITIILWTLVLATTLLARLPRSGATSRQARNPEDGGSAQLRTGPLGRQNRGDVFRARPITVDR
jgi:hypothetical protein